MTKISELRPEKHLIDANFEGYKLSLEQITGSIHPIPNGVHKLEHSDDSYSYVYLVLLSMQNHLFTDPWDENCTYCISETKQIIRIAYEEDPNSVSLHDVITLPNDEDISGEHCYNVSLRFANNRTALVSTGSGGLFVINTGSRKSNLDWIVETRLSVLKGPFTLLDTRIKEETSELHCLVAAVEKVPDTLKTRTELHWVILKKDENNWSVESVFDFNTEGVVRCAFFPTECENLFLESTKPVIVPNDDDSKIGNKKPTYYWQQSADDIKIWFGLPTSCEKDDIEVTINDTNIRVQIKHEVRLDGASFQRLDSELTTWNITDNKLEIILSKHEEGLMWSYLIEHDDCGEQLPASELAQQIHEKLEHLCSENEALSDDTVPSFNPGQLEACDSVPDEESRLVLLDGETKKIIRQANLSGHQKLFNIRLNDTDSCICVRHDVDGVLWKLDPRNENLCKHVGTVNAFGYVLASKEWKYAICSPDFSYAVIASTKQNLFVYKQNCAVNTELRNRKTGQLFPKVGKQYLISVNSSDEIIGIHATNVYLAVLTKFQVHVYYMKDVK